MKPRTIKPTLCPPVEDEPAIPPYIGRVPPADAEATAIARAYRCPSHGRTRTASVTYTEGEWVISGLCCDRATATVRAELDV